MKWELGLAAIAAMSMSPAAEGAIVLVTYTGVASGTDETNFFGAGNVFNNQPFELQFTLNSAAPGTEIQCESTWCELEGDFAANPLTTTRFTINGVSRNWGDSTFYSYGFTWQYNEPGQFGYGDSVLHQSEDRAGPGDSDQVNIEIQSMVNNFTGSTDLTDPLDYFVQPDDDTFGFFSTSDRDPVTRVYSRNVFADLSPTRVTIAPLEAAIPEPSTWAMLIVGFGLVGAVMRRRAKVPLVVG